MSSWEELLSGYRDLIVRALNQAFDDIPRLFSNPTVDFQTAGLLCIYFTILQSAKQIWLLWASDEFVGGPDFIMRATLESYADLGAVTNEADYILRMEASNLEQQAKLLRNAVKGNPTLWWFSSPGADPAAELAKVEKQLKDLGQTAPSHAARFKTGGIIEFYNTLYWKYSIDGHNNIAALRQRHFEPAAGGASLTLKKVPDKERLITMMDELTMVLVGSNAHVHRFLKTGRESLYESWMQKHRDFGTLANSTRAAHGSWTPLTEVGHLFRVEVAPPTIDGFLNASPPR